MPNERSWRAEHCVCCSICNVPKIGAVSIAWLATIANAATDTMPACKWQITMEGEGLGDDPSVFDQSFDIGDIFAMRPWTFEEGLLESNGIEDADGDGSTTPQLKSAEFGLLSAGPNRRVDNARRFDVDELNRDNIREVGP